MSKGFTLIEFALSLALIGILASIFIPISGLLQSRNNLDLATTITVHALRRTQILSQAVESDTSWGINISNGNVIIFKGTNFIERDMNFDEIFNLPSNITLSGIGEIIFAKFSGEPQTVGNIILTSSNNETRKITINQKGMVSY